MIPADLKSDRSNSLKDPTYKPCTENYKGFYYRHTAKVDGLLPSSSLGNIFTNVVMQVKLN